MDSIKRLNLVVEYIEDNLSEDIDYKKIADIASCSVYHIQIMFAFVTNTTLSEYIRHRRMTKAAVDLSHDNEKVIDVALKYGYESPTAFNRAFQSVHGIAPSQAKYNAVSLKCYPRISFKFTIKGDTEMNFRIEKKEAFKIIGVSMPLSQEIEDNFKSIPKFWNDKCSEGIIEKLSGLIKNEPMGVLGACVHEKDNMRYFIAVSNKDAINHGFDEYKVPASTWAIFTGEGIIPTAIQSLIKSIYTDWFPTSGFEYANAVEIEVYLNDEHQNSKFEVWIPVIKKDK